MTWPADRRARGLAIELYESVATRPLVSVHNGLPARYLAEDLPFTDPINLLVSHDQGVQALLRAHDVRTDFSPSDGWQVGAGQVGAGQVGGGHLEPGQVSGGHLDSVQVSDWQHEASRQAFILLWRHLVEVGSKPWMAQDAGRLARIAGLPPFVSGEDPTAVYDELAARMLRDPVHPRRVLAEANIASLSTSDDPADDLEAHAILAQDPAWAGRIRPTFSPDRYLQPGRRGWRTDADLLAELTDTGTEDLDGFLDALRQRRQYFIAHGAAVSEHHASDIGISRIPDSDAAGLYGLARSGELLPPEARALHGHLLWEMGRMSADDHLVMALYPPAGFRATTGPSRDDRGVAARVRPVLADFGSADGFRAWLFCIDPAVYTDELAPLALEHPALTAVPPTRFVDDPAVLRSARVAAIRAMRSGRALGLVDDMSGPFALVERHRLGRRLDAGALAELVVDGVLSESQAYAELGAALDRSMLESPVARAT